VVQPEHRIFLGIGEIPTLHFGSVVERVDITSKGTVETLPRTDHQFALHDRSTR
jgi:hypothetical protein